MRNKLKIVKLLGCCIILVSGWSCKKAPLCDCFESAGSPSSETRSVPAFNQVTVCDDINVFLSVGPQQVTVEGGKNLIKNIATNVSGGVLTLNNNNICNWMRSYKKSVINVYIASPKLTWITSAGVGTIQSTDTLTYDTLTLQTKSSGDINLLVHSHIIYGSLFSSSDLTLSGSTNSFNCNFYDGTGFVYCNNLSTNYVFMSNNSTGDCYINDDGEMDVTIYKMGNVYYTGNPSPINIKTYGSGQLIKQ